uniref:2',3'-cyclic-nucleotide 3'-phosphodiesterase n=1 Tax=Rhipicephalus zambeziensis TaxID=60191 RepID=A0A224YI47_9ACAR
MDSSEDSGTCQLPASADGGAGKTLFTDDIDVLDVVDFPCLADDDTMEFLRSHGRILFLSRGPPGSGKGTVATRLHELYPDSRIYWSDKMFLTPLAPPRTKETLNQSHELCLQKITEYMQQNTPVIINRNTNMSVWEASPYLRIAATYGYTVIILNIDKNLILKPEVLAVTNSKGLDQSYMKNRLKQWEHIYPYAMGWSPRPRDAAFLLRRYRELSAALANNGIVLKPVQCEQFFPFCIARLCWFGWDEQDRHFCHSEPVKKAYGSKDTITVLGYAAVGDLVMAVVELTEAQAALMGDSEQPANLEMAISRHANGQECDEMLCTVDLHNMFMQNETDETVVLQEGAACSELPPPSRVSFILLGSTTAKAVKYSSAVLRASLLHNHMRSWRVTGAGPRICADADGVSVYGTPADAPDDMCLLIADKKTVRLDTVFTGYYQAHTSRSSGRDRRWSTGNYKCESQDRRTFDRYLQGTTTMPLKKTGQLSSGRHTASAGLCRCSMSQA